MTPPTPNRRRRKPPGPPVEVMVWRVTPKPGGRGEHRKLIDTVHAKQWEHIWQYRHPGPGRYRLEFRDDRRQIAKVEYVNALPLDQGGLVVKTQGRHRPSKRAIPPPVAAWDTTSPTLEQLRTQAEQQRRAQAVPQRTPPKPAAAPRPPARVYPPLTPPGAAPQGMFWRLWQKGNWELISGEQGKTLQNYVLLRLPHGEHIFVFSPAKRWPGYALRRLSSGAECLIPQG